MKFLKELLTEAEIRPNVYFEVMRPFHVWVGHSSNRGFPTFEKITADSTDEIHWLKGGMFLVDSETGNVTESIHLDDPRNRGEGDYHAYRNNPTGYVARQLNELVRADRIAELDKREATSVASYRS